MCCAFPANVGTPAQEFGSEPRRDLGRQNLLGEIPSTLHVAGELAEQDADAVLGHDDLALELRDGRGRD